MKEKSERVEQTPEPSVVFGFWAISIFFIGLMAAVVVTLGNISFGGLASGTGNGTDMNTGFLSGTSAAAETERTPDEADALLASMTLDEKVYQLFVVTPEQLTGISGTATVSGNTTKEALESRPVGGMVYFSGNLVTPDQVKTMIENAQSYAKTPMLIAVDEEGGSVARLGSNSSMNMTKVGTMQSIGATGDTNKAFQAGKTLGQEIAAFGFNLDFAPVADVNSDPNNLVIGDRAFSSDAQITSDMVAACVRGFHEAGMICTLKHFPGHGETSGDSHDGMASTDKTLDQLLETELLPFYSGITAGADLVMAGHISCPNAAGDDTPASLSRFLLTDVLREQLQFTGVIVTDAMNMEAITSRYTDGEAAVQAITAGADLILMPNDLEAAASAIRAAVEDGTLTEERLNESVYRILRLKMDYQIISGDGTAAEGERAA